MYASIMLEVCSCPACGLNLMYKIVDGIPVACPRCGHITQQKPPEPENK